MTRFQPRSALRRAGGARDDAEASDWLMTMTPSVPVVLGVAGLVIWLMGIREVRRNGKIGRDALNPG